MKKLLLSFILMLFSASVVTAQESKSFTTYWNNGLRVESADKSFKIKLGGRIQYDVMMMNQDDSLDAHFSAKNGMEFRRARLYTSGTIYKNIKFKFQVDFAPAKVTIKDAYIKLIKIPVVGNIMVGHFKEPFGMEMITSSKYITLMERSLTNQFDFDRNLGGMMYNHQFNKRLSWFAGYFVPSHNLGKYHGNQYHLTFRLTGVPVYKKDDGYRVLHLGVGYSYQYHDNQKLSYKTRPEAHLAPKYIDLEIEELDKVNTFKGELALVLGSLSFQYEYSAGVFMPTSGKGYKNSSYYLDAYFATLSWFITGEHKNYSLTKAAFDRVNPKKNFGEGGGVGAFELAFRYSSVNLNDDDMLGGKMSDFTAGVNWYLNPATRFSFNYVYADVKSLGKANIFQMRFQLAF